MICVVDLHTIEISIIEYYIRRVNYINDKYFS